jgi:ABC-2 type transport system permease protein
MLATATASRAIAATDLDNHQRFLREAEALRFDFVQALNRVHAQELSYSDDLNRNRDEEAAQRARVTAQNWRVLDAFTFTPADIDIRAANAAPSIAALLAWFLGLIGATVWAGSRISV